LNKHNFLISERGAVLIDFETAERSEDNEAMATEMKGLEGQLLHESGIGGARFWMRRRRRPKTFGQRLSRNEIRHRGNRRHEAREARNVS
jgi:tRNA A-37 threonylcarbamoyl transferase component Bud32